MDNLEAIINAAALTVLSGTGSYTYARKADFNLEDDKPAPHIVFFDPTGKTGERVSTYSCLFMFAEPDPATGTRAARYELTQRMVDLSHRFFDELDNNDMLFLGEKQTEKMVRDFAAHLSGIAYQVTITTPLPLNCEPVTV